MTIPRFTLPEDRRAMEQASVSLKLDGRPRSAQMALTGRRVFHDCATPEIIAGRESRRQPFGPPGKIIDNPPVDSPLNDSAPTNDERPGRLTTFISGLVLLLLLVLVVIAISCGAGAGIPLILSPYLLVGAAAETIFTISMIVWRFGRATSSNLLPAPDRDIAVPIELSDRAAKELIIDHRRRGSDLFPFG